VSTPPDAMPRPDWVMIGASTPGGGVILMASQRLTQAELETALEWERDEWSHYERSPRLAQRQFRLTADLLEYVVIVADSYEEAFQRLWETWTPEAARREQIDRHPRIGGSDRPILPA
jgi:hypothetical protein